MDETFPFPFEYIVCDKYIRMKVMKLYAIHLLCEIVFIVWARRPKTEVVIPGDFMLGALFPIHFSKEGKCDVLLNEQDGLQNLEAALYSLNQVNEELTKFCGFRIGIIARDTCFNPNFALGHSLEFAQKRYGTELPGYDNCTCAPGISNNIIGVVGPETSAEAILVAVLLNLFRVPQISYLATSPELSDKTKYKYFKRTVPSDLYQAKGIIDLLRLSRWTYVNILFEDSSYGVDGYNQISEFARQYGVCFGYQKMISDADPATTLRNVVSNLIGKTNANGKLYVILFMQFDLSLKMINLVSKQFDFRNIVWIGSDALIGRQIPEGQEHLVYGTIGLTQQTMELPGFKNYFTSLSPRTHRDNPWFLEYWEDQFNCSLLNQSVSCSERNLTLGDFKELLLTYNVRNSIFAFGAAMREIHKTYCGVGQKGVCVEMKNNMTGDLILDFLGKVSNPFGAVFEFFNGTSDGPPRYSVLQYRKDSSEYSWQEIGGYNEDGLMLTKKYTGDIILEESVCSLNCNVGEFRTKTDLCCWECKTCEESEYVNSSDPYTCRKCDVGFTTTIHRNSCVTLNVEFLTYGNPVVVALLAISVLGVIVSSICFVMFILKRSTPIVKATGFETSVILLISIMISFISPFILTSKPTKYSCGTLRLFIPLSYTMAYSSILSKLMVCNRAFDVQSAIKQTNVKGKPIINKNLCTMKTALVTSLSLTALHSVGIFFWLVADEPKAKISFSESLGILSCEDSNNFSYFVSLSLPFALIFGCLVLAIKTRKLPEGLNDSHQIMYCAATSFVVWIAFVPVYAFSETPSTRVLSLCISLIIHGSACLTLLFITKLYIVIFHPEKNIKDRVMRPTPSRSRLSFSGSIRGSHYETKKETDKCEDVFSDTKKNNVEISSENADQTDIEYNAGTLPFRHSIGVSKGNQEESTGAVLHSPDNDNKAKLVLTDTTNISFDYDIATHSEKPVDFISNQESISFQKDYANPPSHSLNQNSNAFNSSLGFNPLQLLKRSTKKHESSYSIDSSKHTNETDCEKYSTKHNVLNKRRLSASISLPIAQYLTQEDSQHL